MRMLPDIVSPGRLWVVDFPPVSARLEAISKLNQMDTVFPTCEIQSRLPIKYSVHTRGEFSLNSAVLHLFRRNILQAWESGITH